jgi:hypothetical protein
MKQFGVEGFFGYLKYCMKKMPKCLCSEDEKPTTTFSGDLLYQNGWLDRYVFCMEMERHGAGAGVHMRARARLMLKDCVCGNVQQAIVLQPRQSGIPSPWRWIADLVSVQHRRGHGKERYLLACLVCLRFYHPKTIT